MNIVGSSPHSVPIPFHRILLTSYLVLPSFYAVKVAKDGVLSALDLILVAHEGVGVANNIVQISLEDDIATTRYFVEVALYKVILAQNGILVTVDTMIVS